MIASQLALEVFFHSKGRKYCTQGGNQGVVVPIVVCGSHHRKSSKISVIIIYCSHVLLGTVTDVNKLLDLSLFIVVLIT